MAPVVMEAADGRVSDAPTTCSGRKCATRVRLWNIDRLLMVWLYRLYPSLLDAIIIVQPGDRDPLAPTWYPRLLALEVSPRRRPSAD